MSKTKLYSPRLQDSPSRQLILDLAKDLEQVRLHNTELRLVRAYERKSFYENLDRLDREQEEVHNAALNAAAARRDALRREAEETLQEHIRQVEEERERRLEQERRKKEKLEREKAEREQKEREEAARLEAEKRAKEEEEKRKAEEAERSRKAAEEEKARKEQEAIEQEKKKKEEEERVKAEAKRKEEEDKKQEAAGPAVLGVSRLSPQQVAEHQRYVELHQHLKKFRKYMVEQTKTNPVLKQHMGDMRRTIKKCVGQLLTDDKVANRKPTAEISNTLKKALTLQEPSVDIRQFIAFPPPHIANSENPNVPALLIYLLNIFSKAIIAQLIAEAGVTPKYAEPLGVLSAQIFSMEPFVYNGCSMIDLLLAKYHVLCPVLFGFYGNEKTPAGKSAVGWARAEPNGPFVNPQLHEERMIGLGGGFAAISLRNFSKTTRKNPLPNTYFWNALANVVNVPPEEVQETQLIVLGAMLRFSASRVVGFWGDVGMAALRRAVVEFPASLPRKSTAAATVQVLRDIYARDKNILL